MNHPRECLKNSSFFRWSQRKFASWRPLRPIQMIHWCWFICLKYNMHSFCWYNMRIACKSEYGIIFHLQYPYITCHQNVLPFPYISFLFPRHHQKTKENKFALHTQNMCFWQFWKVPSFWTRISFRLSRLQLKTLKTQILHFGFWSKKACRKMRPKTRRSWGLGNHFCRKVCHGFLISRGKPLGLFNLREFQATFEGLSWATKKKKRRCLIGILISWFMK